MQARECLTDHQIPYLELNDEGRGPLLVFSHANGYPPLSYQAMLEPLGECYHLIANLHRPLWLAPGEPETLQSWSQFANDLLALIEYTAREPVVHLGHSMGAAAGMLAAANRPERFRALVLIEPVVVPRRYLVLLRLFAQLAPELIPMVRTTLNRTDRWSSRSESFAHFRSKRVFKKLSDQVLWDYVQHGTVEEPDGSVRLAYSKQWEARCYTLVHNVWQALNNIRIPTLAIRAGESATSFPKAWEKWQRLAPAHDFEIVEEAGHLLPFERPLETAERIDRWLHGLGIRGGS